MLTKARIRDVLACEAGALASDAETSEMNHQLVLGNLVDRVAAAFVVTGRVPDDPFAAVESSRGERDQRCLAWVDAAAPDDLADLREELEETRANESRRRGPASRQRGGPGPKTAPRSRSPAGAFS